MNKAETSNPEWCVSWVECRMCGDKHVSVYPENIIDEDMQECPVCHHMSCEVKEQQRKQREIEKCKLAECDLLMEKEDEIAELKKERDEPKKYPPETDDE